MSEEVTIQRSIDAILECDRCGDVDLRIISHNDNLLEDKRIACKCAVCGYYDSMIVMDFDVVDRLPVDVVTRLHNLANEHDKILDIMASLGNSDREKIMMKYHEKKYETNRNSLRAIINITRRDIPYPETQ